MFQGQPLQVTVKLTLEGAPVTGVVAADLTFSYWRAGDLVLTTLGVLTANWTELGFGLYAFTVPGTLTTKIGALYFRLTCAQSDLHEREFFIKPAPLQLSALPNKCIITGNVVDLKGDPSQADKLVFRVVSLPVKVGSSILTSNRIYTTPDPLGNFAIALVRGALVSVQTEQSGIASQFLVPDQPNALLTDLLPPFPVPPTS